MKRELKIGDGQIIRIENGVVSVPQSGNIQMTVFEIATLFEVYTQTINANVKAVLKSGVVKVDVSCSAVVSGKIIIPDLYGLDMVIALAFRIQSPNAAIFREWMVRKISKMELPEMIKILIQNPVLN